MLGSDRQETGFLVKPQEHLCKESKHHCRCCLHMQKSKQSEVGCVPVCHKKDSAWFLYLMRQIVLLGSDGHEYMFLAKPQDDLRKDSRMMEVAGVINHLFTSQPASRRRNLYLRRRVFLASRLFGWRDRPPSSSVSVQAMVSQAGSHVSASLARRAGATCARAGMLP